MNIPHQNSYDHKLPSVLAGFEHINRYWDKQNNLFAAKILPGQFYVTKSDEVVVTVLGSCVSACIRDPVAGIGGMNHFMLPTDQHNNALTKISDAARYGNNAMEMMINEILKNGGKRENFEIKIFGGGKILQNMTDIGQRNISFIKDYITTEGLNLLAKDVGGVYPRKVYFFQKSGKVRMKKLHSLKNQTIREREVAYMEELKKAPASGEIDLF